MDLVEACPITTNSTTTSASSNMSLRWTGQGHRTCLSILLTRRTACLAPILRQPPCRLLCRCKITCIMLCKWEALQTCPVWEVYQAWLCITCLSSPSNSRLPQHLSKHTPVVPAAKVSPEEATWRVMVSLARIAMKTYEAGFLTIASSQNVFTPESDLTFATIPNVTRDSSKDLLSLFTKECTLARSRIVVRLAPR